MIDDGEAHDVSPLDWLRAGLPLQEVEPAEAIVDHAAISQAARAALAEAARLEIEDVVFYEDESDQSKVSTEEEPDDLVENVGAPLAKVLVVETVAPVEEALGAGEDPEGPEDDESEEMDSEFGEEEDFDPDQEGDADGDEEAGEEEIAVTSQGWRMDRLHIALDEYLRDGSILPVVATLAEAGVVLRYVRAAQARAKDETIEERLASIEDMARSIEEGQGSGAGDESERLSVDELPRALKRFLYAGGPLPVFGDEGIEIASAELSKAQASYAVNPDIVGRDVDFSELLERLSTRIDRVMHGQGLDSNVAEEAARKYERERMEFLRRVESYVLHGHALDEELMVVTTEWVADVEDLMKNIRQARINLSGNPRRRLNLLRDQIQNYAQLPAAVKAYLAGETEEEPTFPEDDMTAVLVVRATLSGITEEIAYDRLHALEKRLVTDLDTKMVHYRQVHEALRRRRDGTSGNSRRSTLRPGAAGVASGRRSKLEGVNSMIERSRNDALANPALPDVEYDENDMTAEGLDRWLEAVRRHSSMPPVLTTARQCDIARHWILTHTGIASREKLLEKIERDRRSLGGKPESVVKRVAGPGDR